MSTRLQLGIEFSVLVMVILIGVISITTSFQNSQDIQEQKRLTLEGRQIGNQRGNLTVQLFGNVLSHIDKAVSSIQGNLTDHRLVTNDTRDHIILPTMNMTQQLIKAFNATNESERGKAVDIINKNTNDKFAILFKGLNITVVDKNTESSNAIQILKKQIEQLENNRPPGLINDSRSDEYPYEAQDEPKRSQTK